MQNPDNILNVRADSVLDRFPDRNSAFRNVEDLEERLFARLGAGRSLGELLDASNELRRRLDRRFPPAPRDPGPSPMPRPLARQLESLARLLADDVANARVTRADAEEFEKSFFETLGGEFRGLAPDRLFERSAAGLRPLDPRGALESERQNANAGGRAMSGKRPARRALDGSSEAQRDPAYREEGRAGIEELIVDDMHPKSGGNMTVFVVTEPPFLGPFAFLNLTLENLKTGESAADLSIGPMHYDPNAQRL